MTMEVSPGALDFLNEIADELELKPGARAALQATGAESAEELYSVLQAFPGLAGPAELSFPEISDLAVQKGGASFQAFMSQAEALETAVDVARGFGASAPPDAAWREGMDVPVPESEREVDFGEPLPEEPASRAVVLPMCPWPVRDQGMRGTCVAFAAAALREHLDCEQQNRIEDLSEQFLYWAIKTHTPDPYPNQDGTWLEYACQALDQYGVCLESLLAYDPVFDPANITKVTPPDPTSAALSDASGRAYSAAVCTRTPGVRGKAALVLNELRTSNRPVAVALPVFVDSINPQSNNWNAAISRTRGKVLDPPPTSVQRGGHAVCVTGYMPDAREALGGHFVIRNSWGTAFFGANLPQPGFAGPEPGYGQVSASYVDRFLWEFCRL